MRYLVFLALCLAASLQLARAAVIEGRVIGVTDGDTVKILVADNQQLIIRLFAIDAPETSCHAWTDDGRRCDEKAQPFGNPAKKQLSALVFGKHVQVVTTGELAQGRTVGTLWADGVDANLQMVAAGYACHYGKYAKRHQDRTTFGRYAEAERLARERRVGQWSDARSVCGWDYRAERRSKFE